jgi:succinate dehydrogenase / fumarate reductase cytochrome b subunit
VFCACYHLANGLWTFMITWGITIGPRSQRIMGYACAALGVGLTITGIAAVYGFKHYDIRSAPPGVAVSTTADGATSLQNH